MVKHNRFAGRIWLLVPLVLFSGCWATGSPPVHHFLLTPMAPAVAAPPVVSDKPLIVVEPVVLPPYLDRTQMVTRLASNHLHFSQTELWGGHLRENISRVLLENLSALLGTDRIFSPTTLSRDLPAFRLVVQVSQFEQGPDGMIVLKGRWHLVHHQTGKMVIVRQSHFVSQPIQVADYEAIAVGMSDLLFQWSQEMAQGMAVHLR